MAHSIVVIKGDDWEAIYIDGECFAQEHHVDRYLIGAINEYKTFESAKSLWLNGEGNEWMQERGDLPEKLVDINRKYIES